MGCALLMTNKYMSDILLLVERIVDVQSRTTWIAKHKFHALILEALDNDFRTSQCHVLTSSNCLPKQAFKLLFN
jgi:hypothetical protein